MSAPALICDTGALMDYLVESSVDHEAYRDAIDTARARYIPGLVLAELDYFLRDERNAMRALVEDIRRGAFLYVPPTNVQLGRAMAIDAKYTDLRLGLVDATVVALAEELDIVRIATRDVSDFSAVRLADGRNLEVVVVPRGALAGRRGLPRRASTRRPRK